MYDMISCDTNIRLVLDPGTGTRTTATTLSTSTYCYSSYSSSINMQHLARAGLCGTSGTKCHYETPAGTYDVPGTYI